jgi:predicted metal-binding protein
MAPDMAATVTLCATCPAGRGDLAARLAIAITAANLPAGVTQTECLSGCTRPSALAVRAPGKTAYLFGEISEADLPDLLTFLRLYTESPDGTLADARPLGALRHKAMARIPG